MADIMRGASPINNRNIIAPMREQRDSTTVPFDFSDLSKVKQTTAEQGLQRDQNTIKNDGSKTAMFRLLSDPETSSTFLKNIFFLREIVGIMMLNNSAETQELANLMKELMVSPENIVSELQNQEAQSSLFRGELFDILRNLSGTSEDMKAAVAELLKAMNNETSRDTVISALKNTFLYLSDALSVSENLSSQMSGIADKFESLLSFIKSEGFNGKAIEMFKNVRSDALESFNDVSSSVLYNEHFSSVIGMAKYSLSRVNISGEYLENSLAELFKQLGDNDGLKAEIYRLVSDYVNGENEIEGLSPSMKALAEILEKGAGNEVLKTLNPESMEKIIMSMLSCPCNYTPLLHYVIPVEYDDKTAFAEMWINPDGDEDRPEKEKKSANVLHVLIVFEVENIGKLETELFVEDKKINLLINCPEESMDIVKGATADIRKAVSTTDYSFEEIRLEKLDEQRSLIEVFKSLPLRRSGLNVTI